MLMVRGTDPHKGSRWMDVSDLALFSPEAGGGRGGVEGCLGLINGLISIL